MSRIDENCSSPMDIVKQDFDTTASNSPNDQSSPSKDKPEIELKERIRKRKSAQIQRKESPQFDVSFETFNIETVKPSPTQKSTYQLRANKSKRKLKQESQKNIDQINDNESNTIQMNGTSHSLASHFEIVSVQSLHKFENYNKKKKNVNINNRSINNTNSLRNLLKNNKNRQQTFGIAKDLSHQPATTKANKYKQFVRKKHQKFQDADKKKKEQSKIGAMKQQLQKTYLTQMAAVRENQTEGNRSTVELMPSKLVNRRKSIHCPIESSMEFIENEIDKDNANNGLSIIKDLKNPNVDLMKKVAFLRVCVNYMLEEIGQPTHLFYKSVTLEALKAKYRKHS